MIINKFQKLGPTGYAMRLVMSVALLMICAVFTAGQEAEQSKSSVETEDSAQTKPHLFRPWQWARGTGEWMGLREKLEKRGVTVKSSFTYDASKISAGGPDSSNIGRGLINVRVDFDLQALLGWSDATASVQYFAKVGRNGEDASSSVFGISNIDAERFHKVGEAWLSKYLLNRHLRVKGGWMDANTEFAFTENGSEFINPSMGYSPTILSLPTYPNPSLGVSVFVYPFNHLSASFGLYKGNQGGRYIIAEGGTKWSLAAGDLPGRVGIGTWQQQGTPTECVNGSVKHDTDGAYVTFDQTVWREKSGSEAPQGIGVFVQLGSVDPNVSVFKNHLATGLSWTGVLPNRQYDVLGVALTQSSLTRGSQTATRSQAVIETFYKWRISPWLSIKPDIEFIRGGAEATRSLAGTIRFSFDF